MMGIKAVLGTPGPSARQGFTPTVSFEVRHKTVVNMLCLPGRGTLTALPEGVLEMIVKKLCRKDTVRPWASIVTELSQ